MAEISKVRFGGVDYDIKSITDTTLSETGTPADAKAVGDEIDSFGTKLFDYTNILKFISSGFSRNGLNVTMSDNVITLDGSTSDSITINSGLFNAPKLKPSTTYTFRILNADGLNNSCAMYLRNTSGNIVTFPWGAGGQSGITFTTPSNIDDVFWRLYIGANVTFSNASGCFMVVEGSTPPTIFVPHKDPLFATNEAVKDVNDNVILNASNITELNSFIRNAITSNILFKESEIIVSGTSNYVYSDINVPADNTSGDINVSIKAVNGNTAAKPAMMRLINKDGTTTSWEWITQTANKTFHHSVSPTGETEKVSIRLYPAQGTVLPSGEAVYNDLIVYCDKPEAHVYDDMYFPVPEYYSTHIKEKITTINAYMAQFSAVGDAFIFITDQHWNFNQQNSLSLIQKIAKDTFVPMLISGGDVRDFGSSDYCKKLKLAFPYEIHHVAGNHDYFWEDGINVGSKLYSYFDTYAGNQVYGNAERHYYYVDNHQKKLRYIFLSAYDVGSSASSLIVNGYEQEQLTWFTNVALDLSDGWEAIVFTHALYGISLATDEYQLIPGASDFVNAIDASGKIIAVFQGHTHRDRVIYTPGEVPVIVTTCDKNILWNDGTYDDLNVDRTSRTINEQAFDVVLIDRANRIIHAVRVGAQALNGIGNTAGSAVAERTIEY